jgi:hypothetical protein
VSREFQVSKVQKAGRQDHRASLELIRLYRGHQDRLEPIRLCRVRRETKVIKETRGIPGILELIRLYRDRLGIRGIRAIRETKGIRETPGLIRLCQDRQEAL